MVHILFINVTIYSLGHQMLTKRLLYIQSLLVSSRTLITLVSEDDGEQDKLLILGLLLQMVML